MNEADSLVAESLQGLCQVHPHLRLDLDHKVVYSEQAAQLRDSQVTVICGGGSGHEPSHAGLVGKGMLTAAVAGNVFASPSATQVLSCLRNVASAKHGTLVVVKNYTGDIINFGRALERARAEGLAEKIELLVVGDDVGVGGGEDSAVGRRGLAGTVLVHKCAGAAAALGGTFEQVKAAAETVVSNVGTIGVALRPCTVPGTANEARQFKGHEIELGMGIHGEPGYQTAQLSTSKNLVKLIIDKILESNPMKGKFANKKVILLVNNLGGSTALEMGIVSKDAVEYLESKSFEVLRLYSGHFMTALDMQGVSLTLLAVPTESEKDLLTWLDYPVEVAGWSNLMGSKGKPWSVSEDFIERAASGSDKTETTTTKDGYLVKAWKPAIIAACEAAIKEEPKITAYDTIWGDGDCGLTLKGGASAIKKAIEADQIPFDDQNPAATIMKISEIVEQTMGGTSGGLYCIFLDALANAFRTSNSADLYAVKQWGTYLNSALASLQKYTTARVGHRTLMDVLIPFVEKFAQENSFEAAVKEASSAVDSTIDMIPLRGRATYVGHGEDEQPYKDPKYRVPDPGAYGLYQLLQGFYNSSKSA
ncbi:dihydroxyacetone kinase [Basidiobolus meristosporus CBS 931.73]|uniref:Dihydroxyacetone kinase n=1 Tax=Basidiobolus meristosporus CBS 931.73 TaxID=1314790 RepID=A0A1Y1YEV1_9FUNG|nr:dihydroxyacetone kinase [Basidiobolus meristosporus CBS 931.73]|eukprot:ORX96488.1 dihydroxyacetone kinase [Basidiobolus meristosporus CBS 931.73]